MFTEMCQTKCDIPVSSSRDTHTCPLISCYNLHMIISHNSFGLQSAFYRPAQVSTAINSLRAVFLVAVIFFLTDCGVLPVNIAK